MIGRYLHVIGLILLAGCAAPTQALVSEPSCKIALRYMQDFKEQAGRPLGLLHAEGLGPTKEDVDYLLNDTQFNISAADAQRVRAELAVREVNVADHCPEIRQWFGQAGVTHDAAKIEVLTKREPWPIAVLKMSVPVLSRSGDTATFYTSEYWGFLGGGTHEVTYKRGNDGRWRLAIKARLTVS